MVISELEMPFPNLSTSKSEHAWYIYPVSDTESTTAAKMIIVAFVYIQTRGVWSSHITVQ